MRGKDIGRGGSYCQITGITGVTGSQKMVGKDIGLWSQTNGGKVIGGGGRVVR